MMGQTMQLLLLLLFSSSLLCQSARVAKPASVYWTKDQFPNPQQDDAMVCRSSASSRVCDPDAILTDHQVRQLGKRIEGFEQRHLVSCRQDTLQLDRDTDADGAVPVQLAVALVEQMDLSPYRYSKQPENLAAEEFARHLHDTWGVGMPLDDCGGGTGVLVLMSLADRVVFISTGTALRPLLTDARLDRIIEHMRPLLRTAKFHDALTLALEEIGEYLQSGKPTYKEDVLQHMEEAIPIFLFGGMLLLFAGSEWTRRRQQRDYARVQSQLGELDRNRAEALQGRYECTSCPICLGDFIDPPHQSSDGQNGSSGEGGAAVPPNVSSDDQQQQLSNVSSTVRKVGSDGLPLKLLRCGHVFDETCWNEWVNSGTGRVNRCPICQQDVGGRGDDTMLGGVLAGNPQLPGQNHNDVGVNHGERGVNLHLRQRRQEDVVQRVLHNYNRERAFRLMALNQRYPQYVRQDQLQRWSQSTYNGDLARDPSFVRNKPQSSKSGSGGRSGGGGGGFGGAGSGGGRGGRW